MLNDVSDNDTAINIITAIYKDYLSAIKNKDIFGKNIIANSSKFNSVTQSHASFLLKQFNIKKPTAVDKIPPKLVKLLANTLYGPLTKTINDSLSSGMFPDTAKLLLPLQLIRVLTKITAFLILGLYVY